MLLDTADLPCIPMHTGPNIHSLYGVMLNTLQTLGEHDYQQVAKILLQSVSGAMKKIENLWTHTDLWGSIGEHLATLRGLVVRFANLSNFYNHLPSSQHRIATSLLQSINFECGAADGGFVGQLGALHQKAMMMVSVLKVKEDPENKKAADDPTGSATKYLSSRLYTGITKVFRCRSPGPSAQMLADCLSLRSPSVQQAIG